MQCPNCGKEAINVNGRYVCLDCGIELNPTGTPVAPVAVTVGPAVDNHGPANLSDAMVDPAPTVTLEPPAPLAEEPVTPTPELTVEPLSAPEAPTPEPTLPETTVPKPPNSEAPVVAEPIKDYFVNALNEDSEAKEPTTDSGIGAPAPEVLPDFPASVSEPTPVASNLSMDSEFSSPEGHDSLAEAPTMPRPTDSPEPPAPAVPENGDYFQPSSLNIQPTAQPETPTEPDLTVAPEPLPEPAITPLTTPGDPSESTPTPELPTTPPAPEPTPTPIPDLSPTPEPEPSLPPMPEPTSTPMVDPAYNQNSPVVDPLDVVSPVDVDGLGAPGANAPTTAPDQNSATFPGTGNLPSTESVFGQPPTTPPVEVGGKAGNWKKWLYVGLAVLGALLLIGGIVYAVMVFSQPKVSDTANSTKNTLAISQNVAGQMDESTDVAADFTQTLDFSKATPKDTSLALFFSKPVDLKSTWGVSKSEDISLDATQSGVETKRIYIKADSATYVYSNDTKAWVKTVGMQLSPDSLFFPTDPRGSLFYLSKVDSFEDQGSDTVNGISVKKIRIIPKKTTIEDILTAANPAFAKIKYDDVNLDALEISAWYDGSNQVQEVSVSGEVEVTSDLYSGPVTITADGNYKYQAQTIAKP